MDGNSTIDTDNDNAMKSKTSSIIRKRRVIVHLLIPIIVFLLIILTSTFFFFASSRIHTARTYSVTKQDMNKTIHIKQYDSVSVALSNTLDLMPVAQVDDGTVMVQQKAVYDNNTKSFSEVFTAQKPGATYIYVIGKSVCPSTGFCFPLQILLLKTKIVVDQ